MQDINNLLADAEKIAERVKMQAEQEVAMAQVLPARFEQNIAAFERFMPSIAHSFKNHKPSKSFRFFCSENGIPNLEWIDEYTSIYGDNPYEECESQISSILNSGNFIRLTVGKEINPLDFLHVNYLNKLVECNESASEKYAPIKVIPDSAPLMIMFGIGLGYQLGYLYEQCRVGNLFLFEPDSDLFFASLYCFDWASLLDYLNKENLGIHLFVGQDDKNIMGDFFGAIQKRGLFLLSNALLCWHYPSPEIFKLIEKVRKDYYLLFMGWGFYDDNIIALSHSINNIRNKTPLLMKNKFVDEKWQNIPVFLIANGPSLDGTIDYIKQYKQNAILVSCGSTISALHKAGIKPDIHVETERTKSVPDFLSFLNDPDYLKDILFLSTDIIHPNCMNIFRRCGLALKSEEPGTIMYGQYYPETNSLVRLKHTNPMVANVGLDFVCTLGFKQIYLFGVDNGYKSKKHHHSKMSAYFDNEESNVDKLTEYMVNAGDFLTPANFGGEILTTMLFDFSRKVLNATIEESDDVCVYNCGDGAKIDSAISLKPEIINLDKGIFFNKDQIIEHIYQDLFSPLDVDVNSMYQHLDVGFFCELMDRLTIEWDVEFKSRAQVLEVMQRQYEYLMVIEKSCQRHIYRMLIGTFNYVFSYLNTMLYQYESEIDTLSVLSDAKEIIKEYFAKAKEIYPKALDSVDMVDNEIIMLFKK